MVLSSTAMKRPRATTSAACHLYASLIVASPGWGAPRTPAERAPRQSGVGRGARHDRFQVRSAWLSFRYIVYTGDAGLSRYIEIVWPRATPRTAYEETGRVTGSRACPAAPTRRSAPARAPAPRAR